MRTTTSLCKECLTTVPARIFEEDGAVFLEKSCPEHGVQRAMIERSSEAYDSYSIYKDNGRSAEGYRSTIVPVTDRCNIRCPHCYQIPSKAGDPSIQDVLKLCEQATSQEIILMGAEPTVREDLPELIQAIVATGKRVLIYTNAIRLDDRAYVEELKNAGLFALCVSLHTRGYLGREDLFERKLTALNVIKSVGIPVHHISFTLRTMSDIPEVLDTMLHLRGRASQYRLRIPATIGVCSDTPFFLSDMEPTLCDELDARNWTYGVVRADNNPYHIMVFINGMFVRIIRWPSIDEVDLSLLECPPYALLVPELGEVNFVHSALVQAALKLRG